MDNESKDIEIPEFCPSCNSDLEEVNGQLFCRNTTGCPAQSIGAIIHFCKVLKIKGLGQKTIEKLKFTDIMDIYTVNQDTLDATLGSKIGNKLAEEIRLSTAAPLEVLLAAFNIPSIGEVAAKKICGIVHNIDEINEETCKRAGLGEITSTKLLRWLNLNLEEYRELPFSFKSTVERSIPKLNTTICITGKLNDYKNRDEAALYLSSLGFRVVDSVSAKTNILIDEEGRESSKSKKAHSLNIPILTIKQTLKRFNI